jgi:energy-coupling factor transporter ATP-binding protein EcfA2
MKPDYQTIDSFNARHLTSAEVARDFIAPGMFPRMLGLNHCILVGPRGSGKTTLLKMLQPDAQHKLSLQAPRIHTGESQIGFIGIFVPADVRWAKQLAVQTYGVDDVRVAEKLYEIAFCTSVLIAILDTIESCKFVSATSNQNIDFQFDLSRSEEAILVRRLGEIWFTPAEVPSISDLKHRLRIRQTKFPLWAAQIKAGAAFNTLVLEDPFLGMEWLDAIVTAIDTINEFTKQYTQRWALLLDELEIVPVSLLKSVVLCLRSTSSKLTFKLALSPTATDIFESILDSDPTVDNDFKIINLWYTERKDLRLFAARLLCQGLSRSEKHQILLEDLPLILGDSRDLDEDDGAENGLQRGISKGEDSLVRRHSDAYNELANKDPSFLSFVARNRIDLKNLEFSDNTPTGPINRKIAPLVQFRNRVVKRWSTERMWARSGKTSYEPFFGWPNLLDLTEGNPRWILTLADHLAGEKQKKQSPISSKSVQTSAIVTMHQRFSAMLKIYPVVQNQNEEPLSLFDFLQRLSTFIRRRLYIDEFSSDPPMSFDVDEEGIEKYGRFIDAAVYLGALVIMNPDFQKQYGQKSQYSKLLGARLRLCYRLAPEFYLPLRSTGRSRISVAAAPHQQIEDTKPIPRKRVKALPPAQQDLF